MSSRKINTPDVRILLTHSNHHTLVTGTTDNGTVKKREALSLQMGSFGWEGLTGRRHGEHHHLHDTMRIKRSKKRESDLPATKTTRFSIERIEKSREIRTASLAHA